VITSLTSLQNTCRILCGAWIVYAVCYFKCAHPFSALMLLVAQEGHLACKNWVVGCWHGYLSWARCRFAYGPADATATYFLLLQ